MWSRTPDGTLTTISRFNLVTISLKSILAYSKLIFIYFNYFSFINPNVLDCLISYVILIEFNIIYSNLYVLLNFRRLCNKLQKLFLYMLNSQHHLENKMEEMCDKIVPLNTCQPQGNYHFENLFAFYYGKKRNMERIFDFFFIFFYIIWKSKWLWK